MTIGLAVDHSRGLCGKPDVDNESLKDLWDIALCVPIHCKCCGSIMTGPSAPDDLNPDNFYLICRFCPKQES